MIRDHFYKSNLSFREKLLSLDFLLIFLILLLGIISIFAMYSTEQGNFNYYTKSHLYRFCIFFIVFLTVSFFKIKFLFKSSYLFYFIILILLIAVDLFGITASGSKRWLNLFFINLQPSELMKIALIVFLARYYYKIPSENISNIKYIIIPFFALLIPVALVTTQPDLGTATLIAISGMAVIWMAGFRMKYFLYSFIIFICLVPVAISFFKTLSKIKNFNFF